MARTTPRLFGRGSWSEVSRIGDILRTETNFFHRAEMDDTRVGSSKKDDPAQVAEQAYEALMKGEEKVVAGSVMTKVQAAASKVMPDSAKAKMHSKMAEPGGGDQ